MPITTDRKPRRKRANGFYLLLLALAGAPFVAQAQVALPDMGDSSGASLSSAEDRRMGEEFLQEIRTHLEVIDDPLVEEYVAGLGYRLVASAGDTDRPFTFIPIANGDINAFAGPGGIIAVFSGLILSTRTESELAAVVAHEIAHVTQRHLSRAIAAGSLSTLKTAAGILAAILVGSQNTSAGAATAVAVTANQVQEQLNFSRANEQEADRLGIVTLSGSGFNPRAMPSFFERLQQEYRYFDEPPEFLSTHPVTTSRISDSRARADAYPYRQVSASFAYYLVKASLAVRAHSNVKDAVAQFADRRKSGRGPDEVGNRYGYVLALMRAKRWRQAGDELSWLLQHYPDEVVFLGAAARIQGRLGVTDEAARTYREGLELFPNNRILLRGYARLLIDLGDYSRAIKLLNDYTGSNPNRDPRMFKFLAEAYDRSGEKMGSHASLAEFDYLNGNLEAAILQLGRARQLPGGDYYLRARIEARLKQFEEQKALREEK